MKKELIYSDPVLLHAGKYLDFFLQESDVQNNILIKRKNGEVYDNFRFQHVPLYRHPFISFENLDFCNGCSEYPDGWGIQTDDIVALVGDGKKPMGTIEWAGEKQPSAKDTVERIFLGRKIREPLCATWRPDRIVDTTTGKKLWVLFIARTGTLGDIYDVDEIISAYLRAGADIARYRDQLQKCFSEIPIVGLFAEPPLPTYDYLTWDRATELEFLLRGLAFGYPIETTLGLMRDAYDRAREAADADN